MMPVVLSRFRSHQDACIAAARSVPVEITSRGTGRREVISTRVFVPAVQAMEDLADSLGGRTIGRFTSGSWSPREQ